MKNPIAKAKTVAGNTIIDDTLTLEMEKAHRSPKINIKTYFLSSIPMEIKKSRNGVDSPVSLSLKSSNPP